VNLIKYEKLILLPSLLKFQQKTGFSSVKSQQFVKKNFVIFIRLFQIEQCSLQGNLSNCIFALKSIIK